MKGLKELICYRTSKRYKRKHQICSSKLEIRIKKKMKQRSSSSMMMKCSIGSSWSRCSMMKNIKSLDRWSLRRKSRRSGRLLLISMRRHSMERCWRPNRSYKRAQRMRSSSRSCHPDRRKLHRSWGISIFHSESQEKLQRRKLAITELARCLVVEPLARSIWPCTSSWENSWLWSLWIKNASPMKFKNKN